MSLCVSVTVVRLVSARGLVQRRGEVAAVALAWKEYEGHSQGDGNREAEILWDPEVQCTDGPDHRPQRRNDDSGRKNAK